MGLTSWLISSILLLDLSCFLPTLLVPVTHSHGVVHINRVSMSTAASMLAWQHTNTDMNYCGVSCWRRSHHRNQWDIKAEAPKELFSGLTFKISKDRTSK